MELDALITLYCNGHFEELTIKDHFRIGDYLWEARQREKGTANIDVDLGILGNIFDQYQYRDVKGG